MAKIKALTADVYNLIAAGEVVDEPVGAVKELVENSVDAGARHITVEIENGGCDLIAVTDEGSGISEDDVDLAFARYATSKLESAAELTGIQSLGFRGEALASIAAVSRIKITTRTGDMDAGICACVENGVVVDKRYVSANKGTKIEVRDLYYNTPARKKFLKSPAGEKAKITKFIARFILTNPTVAITYRADGETVYDSKGIGLDEAIFAVYGEDCLTNCISVNYAKDALRITGYIGTPDYSKANRNYQTLSVNGRCVTDDRISAAILQAYSNYLMTRKFPFFVLNIEIPSDAIDVNIHPKKEIVRFENLNMVAGQFYHAVHNALHDYMEQHSAELYSSRPVEVRDDRAPAYTREQVSAKINEMQENGEIQLMNPGQKEDVLAIERVTQAEEKKQDFEDFLKILQREVTVTNARKNLGLDGNSQDVEQSATLVLEPQPELPPIRKRDEGDDLLDRSRVLGIAFKTYLIIEFDEKLYFIDQHAAHERILFDAFLEGAPKGMQQVLIPYVFTVSDDEALFIRENMQNILSAGIEVQEFGHNTFRITAVSTLLEKVEMKDFVNYLLASVNEFKLDDRKLIVEAIAKKACKAAVKAGQTLGETEIKYLLKAIYHNKILQCPHGRPITTVFTKTQLEKLLKRIV